MRNESQDSFELGSFEGLRLCLIAKDGIQKCCELHTERGTVSRCSNTLLLAALEFSGDRVLMTDFGNNCRTSRFRILVLVKTLNPSIEPKHRSVFYWGIVE